MSIGPITWEELDAMHTKLSKLFDSLSTEDLEKVAAWARARGEYGVWCACLVEFALREASDEVDDQVE